MRIKLTKKDNAIFGALPKGQEIRVRVPARFATDEYSGQSFAFQALKREHPRENGMEWDSVIYDGMCGACGFELADGECPSCNSKIAAGL